MLNLTIFLLNLIVVLILGNVLLWVDEKRNNHAKPGNETKAIQQSTMRLEDCAKNNGFLQEINELKVQQENLFSKIRALKEATIQLQNGLNEIKPLKHNDAPFQKKGKPSKSNRLKILEEYLKKTG